MIALRDRPAPFGPGRIRPWTLVAITTSSRRAKSRIAPPRISSLWPSEYRFAVSKKLMPVSGMPPGDGVLGDESISRGLYRHRPPTFHSPFLLGTAAVLFLPPGSRQPIAC